MSANNFNHIYTIYKSTNIVNGKAYIGFDKHWPLRRRLHKHCSKTEPYIFYRAIRKYGWNNFRWEIIYQSYDGQHTLDNMEKYFIREHHTHKSEGGYNMTYGGDGQLGLIMSEESKEKLRQY